MTKAESKRLSGELQDIILGMMELAHRVDSLKRELDRHTEEDVKLFPVRKPRKGRPLKFYEELEKRNEEAFLRNVAAAMKVAGGENDIQP